MSGPDTEDDWKRSAEASGWMRPSRRQPIVGSAPRLWQYYWVDFPHDAFAPEFVGEHPGIVVRAARHLTDTCIVVPVTSTPQAAGKHVCKMSRNPNPTYPHTPVWAVCDHLYTINVARLRPCKGKYGNNVYPKVAPQDQAAIIAAVRSTLTIFQETKKEAEASF